MISKHKTLHFIGIGGCGMSAIAWVLLELGYKVSGSDLKENRYTMRLKDLGAKVYFRHDEANLRAADIVVISTAIPDDNVELKLAKQEKIPIYRRAEMLNFLMQQFDKRVAVSGTHGKTTTTAFIARLLGSMDVRPTYVIGGELTDIGGNAQYGVDSPYFVAESDESDGSFLLLEPNIGVISNVEAEHMEYYGDFKRLKTAFRDFMTGIIQRGGTLILNQDDPVLAELMSPFPKDQVITVALEADADITATDIRETENGVRYILNYQGKAQGEVHLRVFGKHNVYNSLSAVAYGIYEGFSIDRIKRGLLLFAGTNRRFQKVGEDKGITIYDDYGHHPTEIRATLSGAKAALNRRIVCIFQPHRYSRTRDLLEGFSTAFDAADLIVVTEIYSAHEKRIEGISGQSIVDRMPKNKRDQTIFVAQKSDIASVLLPKLQDGDVVITLGAGDIHTVAKELYSQIKRHDQLPIQLS